MKTKPEGFFWWKPGHLDDETSAADLAERLPQMYARRGFIDFQVARDTLLIDRDRGKAWIDLGVVEGKQYKVGNFDVTGSRHFSIEDIRRYYPFEEQPRPFTSRVTDFLRRRTPLPFDVFDASRWDDATNKVRTLYNNDGYIYASVRPVLERRYAADSTPVVDLRWEVDENTPAIINRIEIVGNDYTSETCIRDQLVILPGDVFNQDRLIRSWQSIGNLGFFDTPLAFPDTRRANEQGDIDIVFKVKEKRTGNVNFGASMGQGTASAASSGSTSRTSSDSARRGAAVAIRTVLQRLQPHVFRSAHPADSNLGKRHRLPDHGALLHRRPRSQSAHGFAAAVRISRSVGHLDACLPVLWR